MRYLFFSDRVRYPMITLPTPIENLLWVDGTPFSDPVPLLHFMIEGTDPFEWCDYLRPSAHIPLFSPLLRTALQQAGVDNVDYHEAVVTHAASGVARPYLAANVLGQVAAMDRAKSVFKPFRGSASLVRSFDRLVLSENVGTDLHFFRLREFDRLIVADEGVKQAVARSGAQGVIFMNPPDWDGFAT